MPEKIEQIKPIPSVEQLNQEKIELTKPNSGQERAEKISSFFDTLVSKDVLKHNEKQEENPDKINPYDLANDEIISMILEESKGKTDQSGQSYIFQKEDIPRLKEYIHEYLVHHVDGVVITKFICKNLGIPENEVVEVVRKSFLDILESGGVRMAVSIRDNFNLGEDFEHSEKYKQTTINAFWNEVQVGCAVPVGSGSDYHFVKNEFKLPDDIFKLPDGDEKWSHVLKGFNNSIVCLIAEAGNNDNEDRENLLTFIKDFGLDSEYIVEELPITKLLSDPTDKNLAGLKALRETLVDYYSFEVTQDKETIKKNLIRYVKFLTEKEKYKTFQKDFPEICHTVIESLMMMNSQTQDVADYIVENLKKIDEILDPSELSNILLCSVQYYSVANKLKYDKCIVEKDWENRPWFAEVLKKAGEIITAHGLKENPEEDSGYSGEGFSSSDPYENHPWRFTTQQARLSTIVTSAIDGKIEAIKELGSIGLNVENDGHVFSEIDAKIMSAYTEFLLQSLKNPNIKEDDRKALANPESVGVHTSPLIDNIRAFVARYLVQSIEGDFSNSSRLNDLALDIDRIVAEGFAKFIKVCEVEIPLYDKLYAEFDDLRETGRYPLEVFLGRDGIYAWLGRRAQDVARRRKAGLQGRKELREKGEILEINPRYTVYPRYFRDNLNYETKRKFLEQEGISPDADPLFYDTGYTGTIPEQIMKIMEFSDEEIEKRIKLLSAPSAHRRVKGIGENARHEIIEYIEHNSKTEGTAKGLIVDEKTGKIRHIAEPTSPEEQFYFMMVKQAISRHYWLQERLHHEPSGNMNLDSEHYTIRIRQEYAKILPESFIKDPKEFLAHNGELLKGSKGEGEYPDEEVVLFKMTDGTEIVAKKIELRKAKEARKEFSILISAKKAGLPTAEPVGFISGKEEKDGSYLLMKKLEGISGRNFDKHLRESGKFTEDQIKTILKTIVEKNKEMAELFRNTLKIDKRWRIKDTIIEFNEETGEVGNVTPIDWERAQDYNSSGPKEIDEVVLS